ncbi:MAG: M1 family metallopeptidase [Bryobacteraceae bacterium]
MIRRACCVVFLLAGIVRSQPPGGFRLPGDVTPTAYAATLALDAAQPEFKAELTIEVKIVRATNLVWLNAHALRLETASISQAEQIKPAEILPGGENFVGLRVAELLGIGPARIQLRYQGTVDEKTGLGLFHRRYKNESYLVTQFEPTHARTVFPCFDEPGYKAKWQLTLKVPLGNQAFSNASLASTESSPDGSVVFHFAATAPLPSYLMALAVGPFEIVQAGGRMRVIALKGEASAAAYASATLPPILKWFESYLGIAYPFEKLDFIAIPGCGSGAMEQPGLVTMCAPQLLVTAAENNLLHQRDFHRICAHEIAHQWFGNLVTPAWWNDIWLSEGFANWLQGEYLRSQKPEWMFWADEQRAQALTMRDDRGGAARSLDQAVHTETEIETAFGAIAYVKGAAVLRMFDDALGHERFLTTLQSYLKNHGYGNANSDDLIHAVRESAGVELASQFSSLVRHSGFPVLRKANPDFRGYYVVDYEPGELKEIAIEKWSRLPDAARASTVYNEMVELPASLPQLVDFLRFAEPSLADAGPGFLLAYGEMLKAIGPFVPGDLQVRYEKYIRRCLGMEAKRLGWRTSATDAMAALLVRKAIVPYVADSGNDKLLQRAAKPIVQSWLENGPVPLRDWQQPLVVAAARDGDRALFDLFLNALRKPDTPRRPLLTGLGSFGEPALEQRAERLWPDGGMSFDDWEIAMEARPATTPLLIARLKFLSEQTNRLKRADLEVLIAGLLQNSCSAEATVYAKAANQTCVTAQANARESIEKLLEGTLR